MKLTSRIQQIYYKTFWEQGLWRSFWDSYKDSVSNGEIELSISDLGFIRWNDKTSNMHIESQYEFEGINIDDFISFSDSIIRNKIDSYNRIYKVI